VTLRDFIGAIEDACGANAVENLMPMQAGDVPTTFADIDDLISDIQFNPSTSISTGIKEFVKWYKKNN
jgi:UDP-glucuronate 4-epimerase